jgi:hypothetical protein
MTICAFRKGSLDAEYSRGLGSRPAPGGDSSEVMIVRDAALVMDKGSMRASDRDRAVTMAVLRDAYVAGRLTVTLPLMLLALFALWAAGWRTER